MRWVSVLGLLWSAPAFAQPADPQPEPSNPTPLQPSPQTSPPPPPPPQPYPQPPPGYPPPGYPPPGYPPYVVPPPAKPPLDEPLIRRGIGGGTSGSLDGDAKPMIVLEVGLSHRIGDSMFTIGVRGNLSYRNFDTVADIYSSIHDSLKDENEALQVFGYFFGYGLGWLAGFGVFGAGPELVISAPKLAKPWGSIGTQVFTFIDPDSDPKVIRGHGVRLAGGYDFTRDVGISLSLVYAPEDGGGVFGTTGPAVLMGMATLDLRGSTLFGKRK